MINRDGDWPYLKVTETVDEAMAILGARIGR
jgi:hypothetical protein